MRFVAAKTVDQQSRAANFRARERLVHQRSADANALRALLYEHGHVFPAGIRHLNRMTIVLENEASDLPALIREECLDLLAQISEKTTRITERTKKFSTLATQSDWARRLQTMADVAPRTAVAVEVFGPYRLITILARGFSKCRIKRPDKSAHSITCRQGQKLLASRAATTKVARII
jgi:transposase